MGWISPTGNNDPSSGWTLETKAYDGSTGTDARSSEILNEWTTFLELTHASMLCNKVRFMAYGNPLWSPVIDIDVYYSGTWYHLYQGSWTNNTWVEKAIGSVQSITAFRFRIQNNSAVYGGYASIWEVDFNQLTLATVTTQAVTAIDHESGTGNGNITAVGSANPTKRGICWNTTGNPTIADSKSEETGSFGTGAFTRPITGLSPGVQYFVKAYAYNEAGYAYGGEVNFTTDKVAPTVTTQDATAIGQNQVKGNGNITATGGEDCSERGFEYGLTQTPTWTEKETVGGYGAGAFSLIIYDLEANTEYWYRAYAKNTVDPFYGYGEWVQFQTSATGVIPLGPKISICSDYLGYTYKLNKSLLDNEETYESYFVLSTDLAQKQGLHINKRLEDLYSYFMKKDNGTAKIYIKRDNEAEWQYAGEISLTGDEDIIIKHLPSENEDITGDVDFLAKHFLIKFVFENDFEFIGLITEAIYEGVR